jgi:DNA-binding response OmpR family regulator
MWSARVGCHEAKVVMTPRATDLIFIVERDRHVRELLLAFLDSPVYTLEFFDDGETALAAIWERRPRLVILEILVPRLDGLGLCRQVKLSPALSDTPVLVLSILNAHDRARLAGADAFMLKPLDRQRLVATVESLLAPPTAAAAAAQ